MTNHDLCFLPAAELAARIRDRQVSPLEVVDAHLERIERVGRRTNAYTLVLADAAREQARGAEASLARGNPAGPLHGVPVAIKDLDDVRGVATSFGSKVMTGYVPARSATFVERLEAAGAIVLGKTNTPEFGHKGTTDNLVYGPTSTPFAPGYNAGGSSGGSAAAVADGLAPLAQGTDGGGSVRIPASWSGVFGLKPSHGRVAIATRPDGFLWRTPFVHVGPLARTVRDAALMAAVMAGPHPRDPLSLPDTGTDWLGAVTHSIAGLRVAYLPDLGGFPIAQSVRSVVDTAVLALTEAGANVELATIELPRPHQELAELWIREIAVHYRAIAAHLRDLGFDLIARADELTPDFRLMLEFAERIGAVEYLGDDVLRTSVLDAVEDVFDQFDLIVSPTLAIPPVENAGDGKTVGPAEIGGESIDPLIGWCLTFLFNFTGHPAASVPAGFADDNLPIGMQIVGKRFADDTVIAASAAFEQAYPWSATYKELADFQSHPPRGALEGCGEEGSRARQSAVDTYRTSD